MNLKSYCTKKAFLFYCIPTAIISAIIYWFLEKEDMSITSMGSNAWIAVVVTVFICVLTAVPGFRSDKKKGKLVVEQKKGACCLLSALPSNMILMALVLGIYGVLVFFSLCGIMTTFVPTLVIPRIGYIVFKSVVIGLIVAGAIAFSAAKVMVD